MDAEAIGDNDFVSTPSDLSPSARRGQVGRLQQLLLEDRVPVVNVHGAPGAGKTRFVRYFAGRHEDVFAGGITWLVGRGDLDHARLAQLPEDRRALVVIDEVELVNVPSLRDELGWLRKRRPLTQVITISRLNLSVGRDMPAVEMPPLSLEAVVALLTDGAARSDRDRVERLARLLEGNASAVVETSRRLASGMPIERIIEWLEQRRLVVARDTQGSVLPLGSPERQRLDMAVDEISDGLIRELAAHPERLYELNPRRFEELVAELYQRRGFEATLTPASGDEGVDVYVVRHDDLGRTLWVVQAKRYAAHHKVGAGVVRELLGTVHAQNASAGILVTTSFFQPGAVKVEQEFEYRIALRDYLGLQDMLRW